VKKVKPRIKKVFEKVMENNGFNVGKAMIEEGYSPNSAKNPKQVTETKSWAILSEEYLPDTLIGETHKQAFTANKVISARTMGNANENTDDFIDVPDWQTRMKAVELGYKVKGRLIDRNDLTTNGKDLKGLIQINEDNKS
jgi:uncharacterized protein YdaT